MKKLLHERLREYVYPFRNIHIIEEREGVSTYPQMFEKWADEIERNYIPRPRFDDDEPVDFHERMGNGKHVRRIIFREDGWTVDSGKDGAKRYGSYNSGTCKAIPRYHESVLDADGVEIKVGDTVYRESDGEKLTVKSVFVDIICGGCFTSEEFGVGYLAKYFTHERPVFDAEGVRIRKGDTVWSVADKSRGTVVSIILDNTWHGYPVKVAWDKGDEGFYPGDAITHREPDSLKKLRDDMRKYGTNFEIASGWPHDKSKYTEFADRLTALIERGA